MNYSLTETNVFLFLILQGNEQDVLGTKEHEDKSEDEKTYEEEEDQEEGEEDARTIQDFLGKNKYSKYIIFTGRFLRHIYIKNILNWNAFKSSTFKIKFI